MLAEAEVGILFHAPQNVKDEFPQFQAVDTFLDLKHAFIAPLICFHSLYDSSTAPSGLRARDKGKANRHASPNSDRMQQ